MLNFKIDSKKCVKCGACVGDCPARIIKMEEGAVPAIKAESEEKCMKCQHCFTVCPTGAISIFGLDPQEDSIELNAQSMPTPESIDVLARGRRSVRKYKQENVAESLVEQMLLTTANCPTAVNNNLLRFDVISDIEKMNVIREGLMAELIEFRAQQEFPPPVAYLEGVVEPWKKYKADSIFRTAPHALIVSTPKDMPVCSLVDVSIALSYFELVAHANGLGTTWCGMLKMCMEILPTYKEKLLSLGIEGTGEYYCMLFGKPDVKFVRTAKKDSVAKINFI